MRNRVAAILATGAILALAPSAAFAAAPAGALTWQVASVQASAGQESAAIHGIACASSTTCAAVGNITTQQGFQQGAALVTDDAGSSWAPASAGAAQSGFQGVNYFGADCAALNCVAVGTVGYNNNAIATSTNGGTSWTPLASVPQPSSVQNNLAAVSCATYADCVAVGSDIGTTGAIGHFQILVSTSGGATWVPVKGLPQPSADNLLTGVSCVGTDCVAVGYDQSPSGQVNNAILVSSNSGQNWSLSANVPQPSGSSQWLSGVSCISGAQCVAVGYETNNAGYNLNQVLVSNNGGQNWTLASNVPQPGISTNGDTLNAVTCNAVECVAVGQYTSAAWVPENQILVSTNEGNTWTLEAAPNPGGPFSSQQLTAVACASPTACMALGTVSGMNGGAVEALYGIS